jgi:hypothetical protein
VDSSRGDAWQFACPDTNSSRSLNSSIALDGSGVHCE